LVVRCLMKKYSKAKKIIFAFTALLVFGLGASYLSSYLTLNRCSHLVYLEAKKSNINARYFDGGTFTYRDIEIYTTIDGPFQVTSNYSVPNGFHAIIYEYKYWGIFGHAIFRSKSKVYLL